MDFVGIVSYLGYTLVIRAIAMYFLFALFF